MFHAVDSHIQQTLHNIRGIHMCGAGASQAVGGFDDGAEFIVAQLFVLRPVMRGGKTAAGHNFNELRAVLDLLAHGIPKEIRSAAHALYLAAVQLGQQWVFGQALAQIGMPSGNTQRPKAVYQPRTLKISALNRTRYIGNTVIKRFDRAGQPQ